MDLLDDMDFAIPQFVKLNCGGRKIAVTYTGSFDEFCQKASRKLGIKDIIITTSDDTEVDKDYFEYVYKAETLYAKERSATMNVLKSDDWPQNQPIETVPQIPDPPLMLNPPQALAQSPLPSSCAAPQALLSSWVYTGQNQSTYINQSSSQSTSSSSSINCSQESFSVPWTKFAAETQKCFKDEEVVNKKVKCNIVNVLWDSISETNNRPSRRLLRAISAKVINRYPKCFQRYIDGVRHYDEIEDLMLSLEHKRDNCLRNSTVKSDKKDIKSNQAEDTYDKQREDLSKTNLSCCEIKAKWPSLFTETNFVNYFQKHTGYSLVKGFSDEVFGKQCQRIYNYQKFHNKLKCIDTCIPELSRCTDVVYHLITEEYNEDVTHLIEYQEELNTKKIPCTPFIVAVGSSIFTSKRYIILVDKDVLFEVDSLRSAFKIHFASFFVFNVEWPKKLCNTMETMQRFVLKMKVKTKKKRKINEKILKFAEEVAKYEALEELSE